MKYVIRFVYALAITLFLLLIVFNLAPNADTTGIRILGTASWVLGWGLAGKLNE